MAMTMCYNANLEENQRFCYYKTTMNSSLSFDHCWMKVDNQSNFFPMNSTNPDLVYSEEATILGGVISIILSFFGLILNSFVIFGIAKSPELQKEYLTPTIISIALTDLIFSIINLPIQANFFITRDQPVGCNFYNFFGYVLWFCSAFNLVVIAILRAIAVSFPRKLKNPYSPLAHSKAILPLLAWIFSTILWIPTLTHHFGRFGVECKSFICKVINVDNENRSIHQGPEEIYAGLIILSFILVLILNIITFVQIRKRTRQVINGFKSSLKGNKDEDADKAVKDVKERMIKKEWNMGKYVARITASFFIVYFPYMIVVSIDPNMLITRPFTSIVVNALTNSLVIIDPLIYIYANKTYLGEIKARLNSTIRRKVKDDSAKEAKVTQATNKCFQEQKY